MKQSHFTVVIPTRERCDTLEHALRTCVLQHYDNLEIIVSDNFSQDRTKEIVDSFKDSRVRYINTGKRLSMSENFEFSLSHVKPKGYVIYIGDDDGLLPNAITDINEIIVETGTQVLRWDVASYAWPGEGGGYSNLLQIRSLDSGISLHSSAKTIQDVLSFRAPYQSLPVMYIYSAVAYEVINKIKNLSGRFYHSMTPDVYSGFAIAGCVDSFVHSKRPYAIGGSSHHSNGASASRSSLTQPAKQFLSENNLPFHSSLPFCISINLMIIESYLQARDHLPFFKRFEVDMDRLLFNMMKESVSKTQDLYQTVKDVVLKLGQMHSIQAAAEYAIAANPNSGMGFNRRPKAYRLARAAFNAARLFISDIRKRSYYLDCNSLNVSNVCDAAILVGHIIGLRKMNLLGFLSVMKSSLNHMRRVMLVHPEGAYFSKLLPRSGMSQRISSQPKTKHHE
jgi:glycosyltransferase involved in cell wall biosynthesis